MTKRDSEARIIGLAQKMRIRIITKKEGKHDRAGKDKQVLSDKS